MEGGLWTFRGHLVLMAVYGGFTKPSEIELSTFKIWIQIHDLPDGYRPLLETMAAKVGEVIATKNVSGDFSGNFYRVRVLCDVRKPLKVVTSIIRGGQRQLFLVKYDQLPDWCSFCGYIGHLHTEHGDGVHPPDSLVFKNLKVEWNMRGPGTDRGRGRGRGSGRGLDRGARDLNSSESYSATDDDEEDDRIDVDPRKDKVNAGGVEGGASAAGALGVNNLVLRFQNETVPPSPLPKRDPKRKKPAVEEEGKRRVMKGETS
ncbi:hypothetical protein ACQ4PT_072096 [Festuca glaucescens]